MKDKQKIHNLVSGWIKGTITADEKAELESWLGESPANRQWFDAFTDKRNLKDSLRLYSAFHTDDKYNELENLFGNTEKSKNFQVNKTQKPVVSKVEIFVRYWRQIAAVVVLFVSCLIFFNVNDEEQTIPMCFTDNTTSHNQAVLIVENGEEIILGGLKDSCLHLAQGENVFVDEEERLSYKSAANTNDNRELFHILQTPRGGEYKLVLEDGTQVWLNSETKLRYPVHFSAKERKVYLEGEAYFKVARNEKSPFIVETVKQDIVVLGTSFDVMAYGDEDKVYTTLIEGSVEVRSELGLHKLKPGEQAVLSNEGVKIQKVDVVLYSSWIYDRFVFVSEDLESVTRKLRRWYDVEFVFTNENLKKQCFTGSVPKYANLSKVLKMLELTTDISFRMDMDVIVVGEKNRR